MCAGKDAPSLLPTQDIKEPIWSQKCCAPPWPSWRGWRNCWNWCWRCWHDLFQACEKALAALNGPRLTRDELKELGDRLINAINKAKGDKTDGSRD
jgi:hypothetical protein